MDPATLAPLIEMGLPGVIIIALGWAYWRKSERVDQIMETRIGEMRENLDAINNNTQALESLAQLIRDRRAG